MATSKRATFDTLRFTLELLKRIPRGHKVSAPELHKALTEAGFQRDLRTVQRQLDELAQEFDIERDDRSKPYGYQWKSNARGLSVPGLNEKESLLLALAEQHLRNLLPVEVMRSMHPFFEQARRNLAVPIERPPSVRKARDWLDKVRVVSTTQPLLPPRISPQVFDAVTAALYANTWLDVQYSNAAGVKTQTAVMPLALAQQGTRLYLVCRFKDYHDDRMLALNRVASAKATGLPFERPADFDLDGFEERGGFGFGHGRKIKLEFLIDKLTGVHLLESKVSADQVEEEEGDCYRIRATVTDSEQLKWWLRGFGSAVKVVGPKGFAKAYLS